MPTLLLNQLLTKGDGVPARQSLRGAAEAHSSILNRHNKCQPNRQSSQQEGLLVTSLLCEQSVVPTLFNAQGQPLAQ